MAAKLDKFRLPKLDRIEGRRPKRIFVVFESGRACPMLDQAADLERLGLKAVKVDPDFRSRFAHVMRFDVDSDAAGRSAMPELSIQCDEGECSLRSIRVELEDGSIAVFDPPQGAELVVRELLPPGELPADDRILSPTVYYDEVEELLAREDRQDPERKRQRAFFWDLDRRTEPSLVPVFEKRNPGQARARPDLVMQMNMCLADQLRQRYSTRRSAEHVPNAADRNSSYAPHAQAVSDLYLEIARRHFPGPLGGLDPAAYARAFERFAAGELRVPLPCGAVSTQPSSAYFFHFGEFALFCLGCGIEKQVWRELARPMVGCQEIFFRVYAPCAGAKPHPFMAFFGGNFISSRSRDVRQSGLIDTLRQKFAALELEDLLRESVETARANLSAI